MDSVERQALNARKSAHALASLSAEAKNKVLGGIATELKKNRERILKENKVDVGNAKKTRLNISLIKRLELDNAKINEMIAMVESVIKLEDPIGKTIEARLLDKDLELYKVTVPIGVICAIFESRPDAVVQIASLCIKSGNAVILKCGKEAANTARLIVALVQKALGKNLANAVQIVETREDIGKILKMDDYFDLIIPRGSNSFVKYIQENTRIAVLGHSEGICHVYVDKDADLDKAVDICLDAKVQYPAACNAMETLLVHKDIARKILPELKKQYDRAKVELRGCEKTRKIIRVKKATEKDWHTEYTDLVLSIRVVNSVEEAIAYINKYGSKHTDSIVTENAESAYKFINEVDSASVFHNCSTRFSDGYRYGLGAEVGISTNKIHARGPVGLEGLTIHKYILKGNGHVVATYTGKNPRQFMHMRIHRKWNQ